MLASGSNEYLSFVLSKLRNHDGSFIYATDTVFKDRRRRDVMHLLQKWSTLRKQQNLQSSIVMHANFGGVTSGFHLLSFCHMDPLVFVAPPALPQVLAHILNAASPDAASEIQTPLITHLARQLKRGVFCTLRGSSTSSVPTYGLHVLACLSSRAGLSYPSWHKSTCEPSTYLSIWTTPYLTINGSIASAVLSSG